MSYEIDYDHPLFVTAVQRNKQRVDACVHTLALVREELIDPVAIERQADLLLAVEDLVNEALTLAMDVRSMVWPDKQAHPSSTENPDTQI